MSSKLLQKYFSIARIFSFRHSSSDSLLPFDIAATGSGIYFFSSNTSSDVLVYIAISLSWDSKFSSYRNSHSNFFGKISEKKSKSLKPLLTRASLIDTWSRPSARPVRPIKVSMNRWPLTFTLSRHISNESMRIANKSIYGVEEMVTPSRRMIPLSVLMKEGSSRCLNIWSSSGIRKNISIWEVIRASLWKGDSSALWSSAEQLRKIWG